MARRTQWGVVLSPVEFDLLWDDLGLGESPYPLDVPSHGATMVERAELAAAALAALADVGLVGGADGEDLDAELLENLVLLRHNTLSVDALVFGDRPRRALAAAGDERAVLAVLDGDDLAIEPVHRDRVVHAVMSVIGDARPGPGEQVRLPRAAYSAAMDGYARTGYPGFERALVTSGVQGRAIRPLATMVESRRTASGQLAATGPEGRSPVLSWFDTEAGRYAASTEDGGAEPWVTITPADGALIARRLTELIGGVAG